MRNYLIEYKEKQQHKTSYQTHHCWIRSLVSQQSLKLAEQENRRINSILWRNRKCHQYSTSYIVENKAVLRKKLTEEHMVLNLTVTVPGKLSQAKLY